MDRERWDFYKQKVKQSCLSSNSRLKVERILKRTRMPLVIGAITYGVITHHLFNGVYAFYGSFVLLVFIALLYDCRNNYRLRRGLSKTIHSVDASEIPLLCELYPLFINHPKLSSMLTDNISKRLSYEREANLEWSEESKAVVLDVLLSSAQLTNIMDRTEGLRFSMILLPKVICRGNLVLSEEDLDAISDTYGTAPEHGTMKLSNRLRNFLVSGTWKSSDNTNPSNSANESIHILEPLPVFQKRKGKFFLAYLVSSLIAGDMLCVSHQLLSIILGCLILFLSFMLVLFSGLILTISLDLRRDSLNAYMLQALTAQTESLPSLLETCIRSGAGFQHGTVINLDQSIRWQSVFKLPQGLIGDTYWCLLWMLYQIDEPLPSSLSNRNLAFLHRMVTARSLNPEFSLPIGKVVNGKTTFSWLGLSELTIHALGYLGNKSTLPVLLNVVRNSDNLDTVKMGKRALRR